MIPVGFIINVEASGLYIVKSVNGSINDKKKKEIQIPT
jgi:hypothetical protein